MNAASSLNYLTVYRGPERDRFIDEAREQPPFFDRLTNAWIVVNPDLCKEVIGLGTLHPAPAMEHYRDIPQTLGIPFPSVTFAFDHLPLALYGEPHAQSRRSTSEFIAGRRHALHAYAAERVPALLEPFSRSGRFDVMEAAIKPLVRGLIATIVDIELPDSLHLDDVSLVFDKAISMKRRERLEGDMAALEAHVRARLGAGADDDDVGMRIALILVGKDALVGTLGESLVALFAEARGAPLNTIAFPKMPPQTAVPFVERIVETAFSAGGIDFAAGDRVRIVLQTYSHSPADTHHRFFGGGAHSCLGRPLSVDFWGAMTRHLSTLTSRVEVVSYELAGQNYVFNVARKFEVEITS